MLLFSKTNKTIIIIALAIMVAVAACSDENEGTNSQLPIKNGDHFASGGEVPALFYEIFDGKIVEIQYTKKSTLWENREAYTKYTLNEKYTKEGEVCFDAAYSIPGSTPTGELTGDTITTRYARMLLVIDNELGGVLVSQYEIRTHGGVSGTGEPLDEDLYEWKTCCPLLSLIYEKDGDLYQKGGYGHPSYDELSLFESYILNSADSFMQIVDVKITRK